MPLILPEDYDAIRAAINTALDADNLPDQIIELPIYKDAAELQVTSLTSNTGLNAKLAAIYFCAALLVRRVPQIIRDADGVGGAYEVATVDVDKLIAELNGRAREYLAVILDITSLTGSMPTHFTVGGGGRV